MDLDSISGLDLYGLCQYNGDSTYETVFRYLINLTINLEPVYGIALAFFFFGEKERMTQGFYWGTLLILLAVLLYPFLSSKLFMKRSTGSEVK